MNIKIKIMKKLTLLLVTMFLVGLTSAQTLNDGVAAFNDEQFEKAKTIFNQLNKVKPLAEAYFMLGEVYFKTGDLDSAEINYKQGLVVSPKYYCNTAGLGKIALQKGNKVLANENFDKVRRSAGKDTKLLMAVADAGLTVTKKDTALAGEYIRFAEVRGGKSPDFYLTRGDYYMQRRNLGAAVNDYQNAIFYGGDKAKIHIRLGNLYARVNNFKDADREYKEALAANPNAVLPYKKLGDLNYLYGKYPDAKTNYETYLSKSTSTNKEDKEKYALILFFNKEYDQTEKLINQIASESKDNSVLYRVRAYTAYERGDYANGLSFMKQFFAIQKPEKLIALDFEYNGKLLKEAKTTNDSLAAIDSFLKAFEMDSTKYRNLDEAGKLYAKFNKHNEAIDCFTQLQAIPQVDKSTYIYLVGREYFVMADEIKVLDDTKKTYLMKADSCFTKVTELSPKSYLAFKYKAYIQANLDPQKEDTKIAYEKYLEVLLAGDQVKYKNNIIECYQFLGSYYSSKYWADRASAAGKESKKISIENWQRIIALDPTNKTALEAVTILLKEK